MIALGTTLLGFIPTLFSWKTWVIVGMVSLFAFGKGYYKGYDRADNACTARVVQEMTRQQEVNQKALEEAAGEVSRLEQERDDLQDRIDVNDEVANSSPGAGDQCLDADSVRRIEGLTKGRAD